MKLNKTIIDRLTYEGDGKSTDLRADDSLPGFYVRVFPSGKKSFVIAYRVNGRKRFMTIGKYGKWTYEEAWKDARPKLVSASQGKDPFEEKEQIRKGKTIKELCEEHVRYHESLPAEQRKRTLEGDKRRINKIIVPALGTKKISCVTGADLKKLHHKLTTDSPVSGKATPYEANRTLEFISALFNEAKQWGMFSGENPAQGIKPNKEAKRDRWFTDDEVKAIGQQIERQRDPYVKAAFKLLFLTGMRRGEVLSLKWEYIDFERKEVRLPTTKAGRPHYLPLTQHAIDLLKELPRTSGNPYVLPGMVQGQPLRSIKKAWKKIIDDAKVKDARIHDIRRTCGSWLAQAGKSLHLIGKVLNHSDIGTTAVYARFARDNVREALDEHEARLGQVLPFQKTAVN